MGGFGTWRLADYATDRIAAIAPICGGGEKYWAEQLTDLPIWAFHGAKDTSVPIERTQTMVDEIESLGGKPKFTIYPDADHDSWTKTYEDPRLFEWLLEQKRATP
jgi:predicted peptidase